MLRGLMMDTPLLISSLIAHADRCHGDTEIVSRTIEGPIHRYTYSAAHKRSRRPSSGLVSRAAIALARLPGAGSGIWSSITRYREWAR
jgi:hypothetical protein